jgi:hypothetical protein
MTRVNHADSAKSSQKMTFTWVQIARLHTVSILNQWLTPKMPGNFRLKVAYFLDSQISGEVIHRWDGAFAIPSGWFARGLRDFSGPPEGAERQYRDGGFRSGGLRPVFHAKRVVSVVPAHP